MHLTCLEGKTWARKLSYFLPKSLKVNSLKEFITYLRCHNKSQYFYGIQVCRFMGFFFSYFGCKNKYLLWTPPIASEKLINFFFQKLFLAVAWNLQNISCGCCTKRIAVYRRTNQFHYFVKYWTLLHILWFQQGFRTTYKGILNLAKNYK